jgi:two-component system cell cycle sensor histidine kinase/response regulator CckA
MRSPLRVLIVEDSKADAELTLLAVRQAGFDPDWTRVESEAGFRASLTPELDVIVSDYTMPEFDAARVLSLLGEKGYDIPVIIITGRTTEDVAVECIKQGAADYLSKDRLGRLGRTITRVLRDKEDREEKKLAENALRESEERYRLLVASIPDVTWSADGKGRNIFISPNVERVLGYTAEDIRAMRGGGLFAQVHPEDRREAAARYEALFVSGTPYDTEYRIRASDGKWVWIRDRAIATFERDGVRYASGLASDITERKRLEAQLFQSQKMEAVGRLAGGVAHDFNNLLTAIIGYSQLLLPTFDKDDPRRNKVEEIERAGRSATSLTRQLLAFSRQQVLQPKVMDLNECVANMETMLRRLIGEDIDLVTVMSPDLGRVKADPGQVEQVIINLAVNARDALPHGGKLIIETLDVDLDEQHARDRPDIRPGPYVMLAVGDNGSGMDAHTLENIFEPFFTTKEQGKGTGLGLSTVYGIIEQSGGHIRVYTEPGEGSTFRIYLPRTEEKPEPEAKLAAREEFHENSETILLVEDDERVRTLAQQVLQMKGYAVLTATSGSQAMIESKAYDGVIHLLLTDTVMPEMSGPELAKHLLSRRPEMKVIFMSGYSYDVVAERGMNHQKTAFLQKPFTLDSLARTVRMALQSEGQEGRLERGHTS